MMLAVYAAGIVIWGGLIFFLNGKKPRLLWLLLPGLPLSALADLWLKNPFISAVANQSGVSLIQGSLPPWWFMLFLLLTAPVFDEAVKLLPMGLPWVRRLVVSPHSAIWVGLALGVSFGLGETAFLAYRIATAPANAALPASFFTGYALVRWAYCLLYGVMTAILLTGIQQGGRSILKGSLAAVGLHILMNATALFTQTGALSVNSAGWIILLEFGAALLLLVWLWKRTAPGQKALSSR